MTIEIRLEKLRFLAREMQLALILSKSAPTDADARMIVRHIVIRAENFIEHARQLRRPLTTTGINTKAFHQAKEYYARKFDAHFHVVRDRLSAHVQDLDFGRRIELWNDIEASQASFFADSAVNIYRSLEGFGIPGYVAYAELSELSDPDFIQALVAYRASGSSRARVEMGSDPLAMTRPNSSAMLNTTPIHSRASQIALIHRWITAQARLLGRFAAFPNVVRILKARLITDLVSSADCLITRSVPTGAPQEMDGLDRLMSNEKISPNPIQQFKASYNIEAAISPYRHIRDKLGGHLEDDTSRTLKDLLSELDHADLTEAFSLYDTLRHVFEKACRAAIFLISYLADGQEIYGVLSASHSGSVAPFEPSTEGRTVPVPDPPFTADEQLAEKLEDWLAGTPEEHGHIRSLFYRASLESTELEQFVVSEKFAAGSGERFHHHSFRTIHRFFLDRLQEETNANRVFGILELMRQSGNGDPDSMTEVLLRFLATEHSAPYQAAIAHLFGDLAQWFNEPVKTYLLQGLVGPLPLAINSRIALLRMFVRAEGLIRINRKIETQSFEDALGNLTAGLNETGRLFCLLLLASQFCDRQIATYLRVFEREYDHLRTEIVTLAEILAPETKIARVKDMTRRLVDTHDFVGVALFLNDEFKEGPNEAFAVDLVRFACNGVIVANEHNQSVNHLCGCFLRLELIPQALAIAEGLATRNPENADFQILKAQIMVEMVGGLERAQCLAAQIAQCYVLTDDQLRIVTAIQEHAPDETANQSDKKAAG